MSLSDYEKQVLAQMEAQLSDQDPRLADCMRETSARRGSVAPSAPRRVAWGVVLVLLGLVVLVGGMVLTPTLHGWGFVGTICGVLGFVLMVLGVLVIFGWGAKSGGGASRTHTPAASRPSRSFMDRQEQKWDDRRSQH